MDEPTIDAAAPPEVLPTAAPTRWRRAVAAALRPVRFARRRPVRAAALALLLAVLAAAGGTYLWFHHHLRDAATAVDRGHNAVAARHLAACRRVWPDHPTVLLLAARVARRGGSWVEADAFLDRYSGQYGDDDPLAFERLQMRAARGDLEAAGPLLADRIARGDADAAAAREAVITGMIHRFRWVDAVRAIDDWLAAAPDHPTAWLLRGKLQEQREQTSEALRSYRRVLEIDAEHDEARLRLAVLLVQLHQGEEAVAHLDFLRPRLPGSVEVMVQWPRALALQGRTAEARAALDDCLRAGPDLPAALLERGRYALADGDDAAAETYFGRAVRADPGNQTARRQYALVLARGGKTAEAAREDAAVRQLSADYERINHLIQGPLQANPTDPAVPYEIARIAFRAGQPAEGLRWLQAALRVGPDHRPTHDLLSTYYHETGAPALAAKHRAVAHRLATPRAP